VECVTFVTEKRLGGDALQRVVQTMQEINPNYSYETNSTFGAAEDNLVAQRRFRLARYFLLSLLACINAISIFAFWMRRNMRNYAICLMCGASGKRIRRAVRLEMLLLTTAGFAVGMALYRVMLWLVPMADPYVYRMTPWDFTLFLGSIELCIQGIVSVIYRRSIHNDALIDQIR
jgi:ABC-type antimicrobial peptide transport system permease subunit